MRDLTLHEKISIKGCLVKKFGSGHREVAMLDMRSAIHYWTMLFGKSIAEYWRYL
jgi:hypothetical protein